MHMFKTVCEEHVSFIHEFLCLLCSCHREQCGYFQQGVWWAHVTVKLIDPQHWVFLLLSLFTLGLSERSFSHPPKKSSSSCFQTSLSTFKPGYTPTCCLQIICDCREERHLLHTCLMQRTTDQTQTEECFISSVSVRWTFLIVWGSSSLKESWLALK